MQKDIDNIIGHAKHSFFDLFFVASLVVSLFHINKIFLSYCILPLLYVNIYLRQIRSNKSAELMIDEHRTNHIFKFVGDEHYQLILEIIIIYLNQSMFLIRITRKWMFLLRVSKTIFLIITSKKKPSHQCWYWVKGLNSSVVLGIN